MRAGYSDATKGIAAVLLACTVWGLSPIYYKAIAHVPPLEVLSHRTLWSLGIFAVVLLAQRRLAGLGALVVSDRFWGIALAALMISVNWFTYIWSIQAGHGVEASLGYYIFPLVAVLIGMLAFGERFSRWQAAAVGLAGVAVVVLTYGLGVAPWLALLLATTFALYGLIKKRLNAGPVVSVTAEVLVLSPLALGYLASQHWGWFGAGAGHFGQDLRTSAMLAFSGVITALPLMYFSYASRRITMASLGLAQYLNPTLQFFCATLVFGEPFSRWHMAAFALIWLAVALYSADLIRQDRARKAVSKVAMSGKTVI